MTTVIDELVISLSLNAQNFTRAQQQAIQQLRRFQQQATTTATAAERSAQKMVDGFSRVTKEILGLGASILGVNSLKNFVVDITKAAASTERFALAFNVKPEFLNRWMGAMKIVTNDAERARAGIDALGHALAQWQLSRTGPMLQAIPALQRLGVPVTEELLRPENLESLLRAIQKTITEHPDKVPFITSELSRMVPGGAEMLPLLLRKDLEDLLRKGATLTETEARAAQHLTEEFNTLILAVQRFGNESLPALDRIVTGLANKDAQGVVGGTHEIAGHVLGGASALVGGTGMPPNQIQADTSKGWGWLLTQGLGIDYLTGRGMFSTMPFRQQFTEGQPSPNYFTEPDRPGPAGGFQNWAPTINITVQATPGEDLGRVGERIGRAIRPYLVVPPSGGFAGAR